MGIRQLPYLQPKGDLVMPLDLSLVDQLSTPQSFSYAWKDVVLYALGVGAKLDELDYLFEMNGPKVLPTFAVVPSFSSLIAVSASLGANPMMILHGEQKIQLHRPIPPSGSFTTIAEV